MRKILESIGIAALALLVWISYHALHGPTPLPNRIPTHFAADGQPNAWGPASSIWLLPVVGVALYLLFSVVALFPASFNFPVRVTVANRPRLEALTLQMIACLKVELSCLFLFIQWSIIQSAQNGQGNLPAATMPLFLALVFATLAGFAVAVFKTARKNATS